MQTTFLAIFYTNQPRLNKNYAVHLLMISFYMCINGVIYSPNGNISYACYHQK